MLRWVDIWLSKQFNISKMVISDRSKMRLEKIVLNGFKSFADKIEFEFVDGITAIVGPNGCGKSNVVDALKWVLGNQSPKSLRSGHMSDVIFSGSSSRKASGMAQVSLCFSDVHNLDIEQDALEITRRLYRSGESEYLINGKNCRLKDIKEMFMDTGIGVSAYSIIEQGQIDQLLHASRTGSIALPLAVVWASPTSARADGPLTLPDTDARETEEGATSSAEPSASTTDAVAGSAPDDLEDLEAIAPERRRTKRGIYNHEITLVDVNERAVRVLLGHDLSSGGIRVDSRASLNPGDKLELAIFDSSRGESLVVNAVVERDCGEEGWGLRFVTSGATPVAATAGWTALAFLLLYPTVAAGCRVRSR